MDDLVLVGYTNGLQIRYAKDNEFGGQGSFYNNADDDCIIPLYMFKTHLHRIATTSKGYISAEMAEKSTLGNPSTTASPLVRFVSCLLI